MKTNSDKIKNIMQYSKHGALAEVFVIQALETYSNSVIESKRKWPNDSMISQNAWKSIAQEVIEKLK